MSGEARFRLSDAALGDAIKVASGEAIENGVLHDSPLMEGGKLAPGLAEAAAAIGSPRSTVAVTRLRAGGGQLATMAFGEGQNGGFAAHGGSAGDHDIAWFDSAEAAAIQIGDFLDMTSPAFAAEPASHVVDAAGWAALAALADALREARLESELRRLPLPDPANVDALAAQRVFEAGLATGDPRWTVSAASAISPPDWEFGKQNVAGGISSLTRAGLLDSGMARLSETGLGLVNDLSCALTWGLVVRSRAGYASIAAITVRSPVGGWMMRMLPDARGVELSRVDSARSAVRLAEFLSATGSGPAVSTPKAAFCESCGRERRPGATFCGGCGAKLGGD